jgi:amino acid adenylation domain-containing protein
MLALAEENQLRQWHSNPVYYQRKKTIVELFEEQVKRSADQVAIVCAHQQFTYEELNCRANQVAHYLKNLGAGRETLVGLYMERSVEAVISLLGILKLGAAYVPLDTRHPAERLKYMVNSGRINLLLTQRKLKPVLEQSGATVICVDSEWLKISEESTENLACAIDVQNLLYVIYTSGSTGRPKGVAIQHDSACNLAMAQSQVFDIRPGDRVLQFASLGFDASVSEWTTALLTGACLVLPAGEMPLIGPALVELLRREKITHVTLLPSALGTIEDARLPDLKTLIVAGEACPLDLVRSRSQQCRVLNAYGPTEATVCAAISDPLTGESVPIGRSMANVELYVLDEHLRETGIGIAGELYIGGAGVARGYLGQPSLTADRFIPDPFSGEAGARMYRSGDLVKYRLDGNLEYLGRTDDQIKLRGYRIELGEVEAALREQPQVRDAAVLLRGEANEEKRLVAYVVAQNGAGISNSALRNALRSTLPEYMVPSAFLALDQLPLNTNGKVDRRKLAALGNVAPVQTEQFVPAENELERRLVEIWQEVLNLERVSINDNFFEVGGSSLLVITLRKRIESYLGVPLSVADLFRYPTIKYVSEFLANAVPTSPLDKSHRAQIRLQMAKRRQTKKKERMHS